MVLKFEALDSSDLRHVQKHVPNCDRKYIRPVNLILNIMVQLQLTYFYGLLLNDKAAHRSFLQQIYFF